MDYKFYICPYYDNISCKRLPDKRCEDCPIRGSSARFRYSERAAAITKSLMERHDRELMRGDDK